MALPPVFAELKAQTGEFVAKMREAGDEVEHMAHRGEPAFARVSAVGKAALFGIGGAAVAVGGMSLEMADTFEKSHSRLEAALKAAGSNFEELKPEVDKTSKAMENYGFTNAQTEEALSRLVTATQDPKKSMDEMGLAADIARARNIGLSDASDLVAKAMTGNLRPLKQMGIDLPIAASSALKLQQAHDHLTAAQAAVNAVTAKYPDAASAASKGHAAYEAATAKVTAAQEKLKQQSGASDEIIKALTQRMGGQAAAASATFAGKVEVLKTKAEDLGAKIGLALIPVLVQLASVVGDVINWFERHKTVAEALGIVVGGVLTVAIGAYVAGLISAAATSVASFATMLTSAWAWATGTEAAGAAALLPFLPIVLAVAAVGVAAYELYKHWDQVWGYIKRVTEDAWKLIKQVFGWIVEVAIFPAKLEIAALEYVWHNAWSAIGTAASWAWDHVLKPVFDAFTGAWDTIKSATGGVADFLKGVWSAITGVIKSGINDVLTAVNTVIGFLDGIQIHIPSVGVGPIHTPGFDWGGLGIPKVPYLSAGAVVTRPTLALIGEAGTEAVVPLTGANGRAAAAAGWGAGGGGGVTVHLTLQVAGSLDSATMPQVEAALDRFAADLSDELAAGRSSTRAA